MNEGKCARSDAGNTKKQERAAQLREIIDKYLDRMDSEKLNLLCIFAMNLL